MKETKPGVGMNGETDDFAARYDRMIVGSGTGWAVKTALALGACLAIVALVAALLGG